MKKAVLGVFVVAFVLIASRFAELAILDIVCDSQMLTGDSFTLHNYRPGDIYCAVLARVLLLFHLSQVPKMKISILNGVYWTML